MTKRQLTNIEKKFAFNNLKYLEEELEYKEKVELAQLQYTIDTASIVIKKQLADKEIEKKKKVAEVEELKNTIKILKAQIRVGVEMKSSKKRDKKEDKNDKL